MDSGRQDEICWRNCFEFGWDVACLAVQPFLVEGAKVFKKLKRASRAHAAQLDSKLK